MLSMLGNLALGIFGIVVFVRGFGLITKLINTGFDKIEEKIGGKKEKK